MYSALHNLSSCSDARTRAVPQSAPNLRPSSYTSLAKSFFPDNPAFADFVAAYLLFVRDSHFTNTEDGDEMYTFELFSASYRSAVFGSSRFYPRLRRGY